MAQHPILFLSSFHPTWSLCRPPPPSFFFFYQGPVASHKGRFKPDMAFDPSSTPVAQTTHLCCSLPASNYKLQKKFKSDVDSREVQKKREGANGGVGWSWMTCLFDVCQTGALCHSGRVGAQLQRGELISLLQRSSHSGDHREENTEPGKGGKMASQITRCGTRTELFSEVMNEEQRTEHNLKPGFAIDGHAGPPPRGAVQRRGVAAQWDPDGT